MRLPQKAAARIEHMNNLPGARVSGRDNIGAKDPGMSAGQAVGPFAADFNRVHLKLVHAGLRFLNWRGFNW